MSEQQPGQQPSQPEKKDEISIAQAAASAAAAMFGVQNSKNRERDFQSRSPAKFILMGAVMTCVFITIVLLAVRYAMIKSGAAPG